MTIPTRRRARWAGLIAFAAAGVIATPASALTYTVNSTKDAGPGSLRWAITRANANAGADQIDFAIPGAPEAVHTIRAATDLPAITDEVDILGYSQPGSAPATDAGPAQLRVAIDATATDRALELAADFSRIEGLVVSEAAGAGRDSYGILVTGNLNRIAGNHIGTDAAGVTAAANLGDGIRIDGILNVVGGSSPADRNVISGNGASGVDVRGDGNTVSGNYVGIDAGGAVALENDDGIVVRADFTLIGGSQEGAGNVVSGNGTGITLSPLPVDAIDVPSDNVVAGNLVGTDATGTVAIGNSYEGIQLLDSTGNTVGGSEPGAGNVIAANERSGLQIAKSYPSQQPRDNVVLGNLIGTDRTATLNLGNGVHGVHIDRSSDNAVGDGSATGANTIRNNGGDGIAVEETDDDPAVGNSLLANSIDANDELGIDLGDDDVTGNDPPGTGDPDVGPNDLQNFPLITAATRAGRAPKGPFTHTVEWQLLTTTSTEVRVDFFWSPAADPTGYGEGTVHLGSMTKTTGAVVGTASGTFTRPTLLPPGGVVTMTATPIAGGTPLGTSEFSRAVTVV